MNKIFNFHILNTEAKYIIKNNKFIHVILIIQCAICFLLIGIGSNSFFSTSANANQFKEYIGDKVYYTLVDQIDNIEDYTENPQLTDSLFKFTNELKSNTNFSYVNTVYQPLELVTTDIPDKFRYGFDDGDPEQIFEHNGDMICGVESIRISENVFREFNMKVKEGRSFKPYDFQYKSDVISVILGSQYKDVYKLGDSFMGYNLGTKMNFCVIGFLPENSFIPVKGALLPLDRYIILPTLNNASDLLKNDGYFKSSVLQEASGEIICGGNDLDIKQIINDLTVKYNTCDFAVEKINSTSLTRTIILSEQVVNSSLIIALIIMAFSVAGLSISIIGRIRENFSRYGIHLICGASMNDIFLQMVWLIIIIVQTGFWCSLALSFIFLGIGFYIFMQFLFAILLICATSIISYFAINSLSVNLLIKRKE